MGLLSNIRKKWNVFSNKDPTDNYTVTGPGYYTRQDRIIPTSRIKDRTIVNSIFNRIALDVASVDFMHVKLDENKRFVSEYQTGLNNCLTVEANLDQTARDFINDLVYSMLDEGCIAAIPIDTDLNPNDTQSFDILTMRVGKIIQWYPYSVKVSVWNMEQSRKEEVIVPKASTAIVHNPFYNVINEQNSTVQDILNKMRILDQMDKQAGAGKLDLIIQLPYVLKSENRKAQAEKRRAEIQEQLSSSSLGIAYTDGTEHITQLNRPVENQIYDQVEKLIKRLYSQLGLTEEILNGTAKEEDMLNYFDRTIEPICNAIADEFTRKFLSKTARTQHQRIMFYRDPFKLVPVSRLAEITDSFTRNEVMTSNEVRGILGLKPVDDPSADELRNKNLYDEQGNQINPDGNSKDNEFTNDKTKNEEEIQNE